MITKIEATLDDGTVIVLFPSTPATPPVPDPVVKVDVVTESGEDTTFVPEVA